MESSSVLSTVYKMIKSSRRRYGSLKKCEFHLHTPASHDYRLIEDCKYENLSDIDVINLAEEIGYLSHEQKQHIIDDINKYRSEYYKKELEIKNIPFNNFKEYLSYLLIAHKLYQHKIEVVIISDHNTMLI